MPSKENFRRLFNSLKSYLLQLNLFNIGTQNEISIRNERRSTRVYLVLLIISLLIIIQYHSIIYHAKNIVIYSPSLSEYFTIKEEASLQCPCTNIAVKYEIFTEIEPSYYELCQSEFVSAKWIDHLFHLYDQSWNKSIRIDFRRTGAFQFQTLHSLCQLAKDTINNNLQSLKYTEFVQSQLISPKIFEAQISSFINGLIDETSKSFIRTLSFMQDITAQSLFMTGASVTSVRPVQQYQQYTTPSDAYLQYGTIPYPGINYTFRDDTSCICSSSTATSCMGFAILDGTVVPGFQTGCYMLSALMNSTLEAFYNQTFIDILTNSSIYMKKLNSSNSNWKIRMLLDKIFVQFWLNRTLYDKYFQSCAPELCSYLKIQRYSFWDILILLISLFQGLSTGLRFFAPILVKTIWPIVRKKICRRRSSTSHVVVVQVVPATSLRIRMKLFFQCIKRILLDFNLFKSIPRSEDATILRQQRHQTRLYLFLQLMSLTILTFYASLEPNTISVTIKYPSLSTFIQLNDQYSLTLDCPCSQTSLEYHQFMSDIKVKYYEICSSEFISPHWIELKFIQSPERELFVNDIRYQSKIHFQFLSTLCRVANQTIEDNLQSFYRTKLITNKVITRSSFQTQSNLIIEQFKRTVPQSYLRTLQLMQANPEINQLVVPLNSIFQSTKDIYNNEVIRLKPAENIVRKADTFFPFEHADCFFLLPNECVLETVMWKRLEEIGVIPGMIQTVFPLRSVLLSTLECFYNETCLSYITDEINPFISSKNFSSLDLSLLSTNDSQYDQIDLLVNKLFIQSWDNKSSYESYFNVCFPLTCQYTYRSRFDLIYIITTYIGLFGGLDLVLHFLVPCVIKLSSKIWTKISSRRQNTNRPFGQIALVRTVFHDSPLVLFKYMKKRILELDLFPTIPPSHDEKIIRRSRRLTRIYLTLLIVSLLSLTVYTLKTKQTKIVTLKSPSMSEYLQLSKQYPLTFQCSCNNIAVKYDKFITQIEPQYHSICSNGFLSSDRYDTVWNLDKNYSPDVFDDDDDYRNWIEPQFEIISKMCSLSQDILNSSLLLWLQRDFITARIISPIEFNIQIKELIEEFKRTTNNELILLFKLLQMTNYANQLATTRSSNWEFIVNRSYSAVESAERNIHQNVLHALAIPRIYNEPHCSCALHINCSKFSTLFYRLSNQSMSETLPNFRTGCFPLNAMLQSSFSCLYNQTCLQLLQASIYYAKPFPVKTLTTSSLSALNRTIDVILSQLFVEEWSENISYDLYYKECAPQFCHYSYSSTFNGAYFITKTFAILSGLMVLLRYAVSFTAKIIIKLFNCKKKSKVKPQPNNIVGDLNETTPEIISNSLTTTAEINVDPVQEHMESTENRKDRIIMICLCLLVVITIIATSVISIPKINTNPILTTTPSSTTLITTSMITDSTKPSMEICYMTLIYQSEMYPVGHNAKSLIIIDFNKDSFLDIAVSNYDNHSISILLGNGNGTFQKQQIYSTGNQTYPWEIASGDFDNDTFLDIALFYSEFLQYYIGHYSRFSQCKVILLLLAVTLSATNKIAIFYGTASNGSFIAVPQTLSPSYYMQDTVRVLEANDLNNDGVIELLVDSSYYYISGHTHLIAVLDLDDKRQYRFRNVVDSFGFNIESAVIGDFNNDGKQNDIGVCSSDNKAFVFPAVNNNGNFIEANEWLEVRIHGTPQSIVRGRFNADEFDDIALVAPKSDGLHVLLAGGDGKFFQQIYHADSYPTSVVRINFNNDSIDDLAVLTRQTITIYLGTKTGLFSRDTISFLLDQNCVDECFRSLKAADLNRDGKDDLVFIDLNAKSIRLLLSANCNKHF